MSIPVPQIVVSRVDNGALGHGEIDGPEGSDRHTAFVSHAADYREAREEVIEDAGDPIDKLGRDPKEADREKDVDSSKS
ncbi:60S ribosomal protein L10 [Savitreella phatthalungensis]